MKKTLLIVLVIIILLAAGLFGSRKYTKSFSPESIAEFHEDGINVTVKYSQPAKKNRLIFGRQQDKALVPYGKVWRTGANEATIIELGEGLTLAGKPVKAGSYTLWSVPDQSTWRIILNSETGQWGTEYNDGKDVLAGEAVIRIVPKVRELFKVYFEKEQNGVNMILSWDQTESIVPISKQ